MEKNNHETTIKIDSGDRDRLDRFLAARYPSFSRTAFQRLIKARKIIVDGHPVSPHHRLREGQRIHISWPEAIQAAFRPRKGKGARPPFPVIYEDPSLMVINKPAGLLCHPAGWRRDGQSLVELLAPKLETGDWPDEMRPGLVHRLDRDTSGVLVFAKTPEVHRALSLQFARRQVEKTYVGLVWGVMKCNEGTLECRIGRDLQGGGRFAVTDTGRPAITRFKVIERIKESATYIRLHPLTGRTHQLRVQLSAYRHPIVGDRVYGGWNKSFPSFARQMLHAKGLQFVHPNTKKEVSFVAPLPDDFQTALKVIRST